MAEFDKATVLIHICAAPCGLTNGSPAANKEIISGNQHAVNMPITMANVKATRISTLDCLALLDE